MKKNFNLQKLIIQAVSHMAKNQSRYNTRSKSFEIYSQSHSFRIPRGKVAVKIRPSDDGVFPTIGKHLIAVKPVAADSFPGYGFFFLSGVVVKDVLKIVVENPKACTLISGLIALGIKRPSFSETWDMIDSMFNPMRNRRERKALEGALHHLGDNVKKATGVQTKIFEFLGEPVEQDKKKATEEKEGGGGGAGKEE